VPERSCRVPVAAAQLAQGGGLLVGELGGALEQHPPGALERARGVLVGQLAQLVPGGSADGVQGICDDLDGVERVA